MKLPEFLYPSPYGVVRVVGSRIDLYFVVKKHREGWPPKAIAAEYPSLPEPVVRKVVDYYEANRDEVDAYVRAWDEQAAINMASAPCVDWDALRARFAAMKAAKAAADARAAG